jgi:CHAD domain-containing protein
LREVLPLVGDLHASSVAETLRAAGRHLGRVRELDAMSTLLDTASNRISAGGAVAHAVRRALRDRQIAQRRDMVKTLERLDLAALRDVFAADRRRIGVWAARPADLLRTPPWVGTLWARIATRSSAAVESVNRAPGVYFPQRAHRARIAVKKLRYAVEAATDTGMWRPQRLLKDLRRIQSILGDLHDAQILSDALGELVPGTATTDLAPLKDVLEDDVVRHHAEYMRRRDRIFAIADACARAATHRGARRRRTGSLIAAAVLAAPLVLLSRAHG